MREDQTDEQKIVAEALRKCAVVDAIKSGNAVFSGAAHASVSAMTRENMDRYDRGEYTPAEIAYKKALKGAVIKPEGHEELAASGEVAEHAGERLYTVTTIAVNAMYGGTRTVAICKSFERAREIVLKNECDIHEGSYHLTVIESLVADWIYGGDDRERYWYKWVSDPKDSGLDSGSYVAVECPPGFETRGGFVVG